MVKLSVEIRMFPLVFSNHDVARENSAFSAHRCVFYFQFTESERRPGLQSARLFHRGHTAPCCNGSSVTAACSACPRRIGCGSSPAACCSTCLLYTSDAADE